MFGILALICIILGFIVAIFEVKILFEPLVWFVAAIAFNTLSVGIPSINVFKKEKE